MVYADCSLLHHCWCCQWLEFISPPCEAAEYKPQVCHSIQRFAGTDCLCFGNERGTINAKNDRQAFYSPQAN